MHIRCKEDISCYIIFCFKGIYEVDESVKPSNERNSVRNGECRCFTVRSESGQTLVYPLYKLYPGFFRPILYLLLLDSKVFFPIWTQPHFYDILHVEAEKFLIILYLMTGCL